MLLHKMNKESKNRRQFIELVPFTCWVFIKPPSEKSSSSCGSILEQKTLAKSEIRLMVEDVCLTGDDEVFIGADSNTLTKEGYEGEQTSPRRCAGPEQGPVTRSSCTQELTGPVRNLVNQLGFVFDNVAPIEQVRRESVGYQTIRDNDDVDFSDQGGEEVDLKQRRLSEPARQPSCLGNCSSDIPNPQLNKRAASVDYLPGRMKPRILSMRAKLFTGVGSSRKNSSGEENNNVPMLPNHTISRDGTPLSGNEPNTLNGNNNINNGCQAAQHTLKGKSQSVTYCSKRVRILSARECPLVPQLDETCKDHHRFSEFSQGLGNERSVISIKTGQITEKCIETRRRQENNPAKQCRDNDTDLICNRPRRKTVFNKRDGHASQEDHSLLFTKYEVTQLTAGPTYKDTKEGHHLIETDDTIRRIESEPNMKGVKHRIPGVIMEEDEEASEVMAAPSQRNVPTSKRLRSTSILFPKWLTGREDQCLNYTHDNDVSHTSSRRNISQGTSAISNTQRSNTCGHIDNLTGTQPVISVGLLENDDEGEQSEDSDQEETLSLPGSGRLGGPTCNLGGLAFPTEEERERLQRIADSAIQGISPLKAESSSSLLADGDDMDELKTLAARLNLPTRRPSYCIWKDKYINKSLLGYRGSAEDSDEGVGVKKEDWSLERKMKIDSALEWLQRELRAMRAQDHELARQLMQIRKTIQDVKLQRCTEENRDNLAEAIDIEEERNAFSELFDFVPDQINPSLQHIGVTRMNINSRRFSVF